MNPRPVRTPDPDDSRSLVAEQPGLVWTLVGVFTAVFVGLAFRATFAPEKITALVERAASQVHKDIKITFDRAYLSLSDGLFPELTVVVENVKATVDRPCEMSPQLSVDEVRLPLEMMELVRGRVRLATVEVGHGDLVLKDIPESCKRKPASELSEENTADLPSPQRNDPGTEELNVAAEKRNPVEHVLIRSIRVQSPNERFSGLELRRVRVNARPDTKTVNARGTLILPTESLAGDYGSSADFTLDYKGSPQPELELRAQGTWREGLYRLKAKGDPATKKAEIDFAAEHLPLSPLVTLLHRESVVSSDLSGKQAWISFKMRTEGPVMVGPEMPAVIEGLKLEGDLGEVEADRIHLSQISPLKAQPFKMGLRGVRLEKLFSFLMIKPEAPILGELGSFNGLFSYVNDDDYEMVGEHSGLQFIFSNLGTRQVQTLSLIGGRAAFRKNEWSVVIDRIRPLEGLFLGGINLRADKEWKRVRAHLDIDEMSLHPDVQKLMTGGGSLGIWSGQLDGEVESGTVKQLRGQILVTDVMIENLAIARGTLHISSGPEALKFDFVGKRLHLSRPSPLVSAIQPFFSENFESGSSDQLKLQIESKDFKTLKWKMPAVKVGAVSLRSEGAWDDGGLLTGEVVRSQQGRETKWLIRGTRATPKFEIESRP
ncbi:MAG: hypothetical protein KF681_18680 [Bdellovibrionaceae bacterium]|nr:hypothetical protein [Pseudobdellovibrionaceae bacterium]